MDPLSDEKSRFSRVAWALLPLLALASCNPTPEKIQRWKESEKGPAKLREAVRDDGLSADLRAQALAALVELGMASDVESDLKEVPETQRREVIHEALKPLIALAQGSGKGGATVDSTTRLEREGKDALFVLRDAARPEDRAAIDDALITWTTLDLNARMTAGAHSTEQVLVAIGSKAGPRLVKVILDDATSDANRAEAARFLGRVGDRPAREEAGANLVARSRRQKTLDDGALLQLGLVGGDHAVAFLTSVASDPARPAAQRAKALFALAQAGDAASLPTAMALVTDRKAPGDVRDAAFEVAEKMGPAALPGLAKLLDDKEELVRWRTVEAMLTAGKLRAISPVLEGLSVNRTYTREDLRTYVVHQLTQLGAPSLPTLREELRSKNWVASLCAMEAIGEMGKAEDAAALDALAGDATHLKGWPGNATIGSEAKALAAALRQKK